jgi:hypothetical protein
METPVVNALRDALIRRLVTNAATIAGGFPWGLVLMSWRQLLDRPDFVGCAPVQSVGNDKSLLDGAWRAANTEAPLWVWWTDSPSTNS